MKLSTLLAYQKAFDALRADERPRNSLNPNAYVHMVKAEAAFNSELEQITGCKEVEIKTDWSAA